MTKKSRGYVVTPHIAKRMTYGVLWFGCCACTKENTEKTATFMDPNWSNVFVDSAAQRGLSHPLPDIRDHLTDREERLGTSIACNDIDGDGDLDIVVSRFFEVPDIYTNDGTGFFDKQDNSMQLFSPSGETEFAIAPHFSIGLADINGDGFPDMLMSGLGYLVLYPNDGTGRFADYVIVHTDTEQLGVYLTATLGDVDGDNDLDILLVSNMGYPNNQAHPDFIFINHGDFSFSEGIPLMNNDVGSFSFVGIFTDYDQDGVQDIFIPKDGNGDNYFWQSDAEHNWSNHAQELNLSHDWSAMGIESIDINHDNQMDYCVTDTIGLWCFLSDSDGIYTEMAKALGLYNPDAAPEELPVGWTVLANDLDNDGFLDMSYTGGPMGNQENIVIDNVADEIWRGTANGFVHQSKTSGFGDTRDHYGMVQADFDGDGSLETIITGPNFPPLFYDNIPNNYHWLTISFSGKGGNHEGWGARVDVMAGEKRWTRELLSVVGLSQGAPQVHIGLGEQEHVDQIQITWPDGSTTTAQHIDADQEVVIRAE